MMKTKKTKNMIMFHPTGLVKMLMSAPQPLKSANEATPRLHPLLSTATHPLSQGPTTKLTAPLVRSTASRALVMNEMKPGLTLPCLPLLLPQSSHPRCLPRSIGKAYTALTPITLPKARPACTISAHLRCHAEI
jgi:hypothetical protein